MHLGITWTKRMVKAVPAHKLSGLIRRGVSNPATAQLAQQLRTGLFGTRSVTGGQLDADSLTEGPDEGGPKARLGCDAYPAAGLGHFQSIRLKRNRTGLRE